VDLRDEPAIDALLRARPLDYVFHMAAVHGSAGFQYEPLVRDMMAVNVLALHAVLEHARLRNPQLRIIYAGSAKIFPAPLVGPINEDTPMRATCLYSVSKMAARDLLRLYREAHGVIGTNLVFFNHESPRRPPEYLLPTIARTIAAAGRDPTYQAQIKTLDFLIDWSAADELMDIVVDIAEGSDLDEVVLASGVTWKGRDIVSRLFAEHDLDVADHIIEQLPRSAPGPMFKVQTGRLERAIGRRVEKSVSQIVSEMIQAADVAAAQGGGTL
jgi:GDPmannose 4,6-dehydratase